MSDWKSVLKSLAPTIAAGLGGPLAGAAVTAISKAVLGKDGGSDDELANAIVGASPETLAAIKTAEFEFKARMAQLNVNVFELEVQDRGGARELFRVNHWPQIVLSGLIVTGFFAALFFVLSGWAQMSGTDQAAWLMLGALGTAFTQVLNFWFGSTSGGQAKTNLLAQAGRA